MIGGKDAKENINYTDAFTSVMHREKNQGKDGLLQWRPCYLG